MKLIHGVITPERGRYTRLLDGGQVKGWGSNDSGSSLCAMIKKYYHGIKNTVHQCRQTNFEHLLLVSGGNHNLRPGCRRPPPRTFHTPVGTLRLDASVLD